MKTELREIIGTESSLQEEESSISNRWSQASEELLKGIGFCPKCYDSITPSLEKLLQNVIIIQVMMNIVPLFYIKVAENFLWISGENSYLPLEIFADLLLIGFSILLLRIYCDERKLKKFCVEDLSYFNKLMLASNFILVFSVIFPSTGFLIKAINIFGFFIALLGAPMYIFLIFIVNQLTALKRINSYVKLRRLEKDFDKEGESI